MTLTEQEMMELDAEIAEHVMGKKIFDCVSQLRYGHSEDTLKNSVPAYTTDKAAAMEVLEKCAENGVLNGEFKLPVYIRRRGDMQWVVSESMEDVEELAIRDIIVVEAETLPLAIAKFAKELWKDSK